MGNFKGLLVCLLQQQRMDVKFFFMFKGFNYI